ncbi:ABC transporter permease [Marinactinospora thermotolerans]|uniref:Transport permease protein n=1 Tax=Marinactinospora thermotolerans DSM 45154 TaxID=1122192 RepID=A0A1T4RS25_9ACTN|nr:ABC transporter permease [Marinactinospora thermotolerans]SKA18687.1 ABC-2 type transport system permease protein [Marinactinospora thermotolerans DSM 45154]
MTVQSPPRAPAPRIARAFADSATMTGRSLRRVLRAPDSLLIGVLLPILLLLLFVYVFGGAIRTDGDYIDYVVPGVVLLCAGYGAAITAVSVHNDMTNGVIDRFRSMPITRSAVLVGHVLASLARNLFATFLVLLTALLVGFRPEAGLLDWGAVIGLVLLYVLAVSWVSVCLGLVARSADGASGFSFFVLFLPYLSSAFVPPETMPAVLRAFSEHQPITPITETVRALMMQGTAGDQALVALAWCVGILVVAMVVAQRLFERRTAR